MPEPPRKMASHRRVPIGQGDDFSVIAKWPCLPTSTAGFALQVERAEPFSSTPADSQQRRSVFQIFSPPIGKRPSTGPGSHAHCVEPASVQTTKGFPRQTSRNLRIADAVQPESARATRIFIHISLAT